METTSPFAAEITAQTMPFEAGICLSAVRRKSIIVHGAAGNNAEHFGGALGKLKDTDHPVHAVDGAARLGAIAIPHDAFHAFDTPEGVVSLENVYDSGAVHAEYLSLIPSLHLPAIMSGLKRVEEGKVDFLVVPKPALQNMAEAKTVDAEIERIKAARAMSVPDYNPEADQFVYVHEHYKEKGAWHALREKLGDVMDDLGRLRKVEFHIRESKTAEAEGRTAAFGGGAIEDLAPHILSLGLDVENAHDGHRYRIESGWPEQTISVRTAHYEIRDDSDASEEVKRAEKLAPHVDTGFRIDINTLMRDMRPEAGAEEFYDLNIRWVAGKGLHEDRKEALLEFEDVDGNVSLVKVDLKKNTLEVPKAVGYHFPEAEQRNDGNFEAQYADNGYEYSVESGLNGGRPEESFQLWKEAMKVTQSLEDIKNQAPEFPEQYPLGHLPAWLRD